MFAVARDVLPLLVSIAMHPIGIAVALVLAGRPAGARNGAIFSAGFGAGVLLALIIGRIAAGWHFGQAGTQRRHDLAIIDLVVGVVVILWAIQSVTFGRERLGNGMVGNSIIKALPMTASQLFRKGVTSALFNPKDLAVAVAFGAHLAYLNAGTGANVATTAIFVLVAVIPLLTPAFVASRRGTAPEARLIALDGWILRNLGMTSAIVLTVMGFNIVMTALSHLR